MNIKIKKISIGFAALVLMGAAVSCKRTSGKAVEPEYECIAYVWQEEGKLPPANMVTAINYLAAIPNRTHDGVQINNIPPPFSGYSISKKRIRHLKSYFRWVAQEPNLDGQR